MEEKQLYSELPGIASDISLQESHQDMHQVEQHRKSKGSSCFSSLLNMKLYY